MCPRLFTIGSFSLPTYGLLVAAGFLVGLYLLGKLSQRQGLDPEKMSNLGVYVALAAIAGAKIFMTFADLDVYLEDPGRLFSASWLRAGGTFYGGLLAALATAFWYCRKEGIGGLEAADTFAPAAAIGHSIGRLGCFAAGCCWGKPSSLPWAVMFTDPHARALTGVPLGVHLHPTQIYEALGTFAVGWVLWKLFARPHRAGTILGWYLVLYSSFRFGVEFLRAESPRNFLFDGPLSTTQWIAILLVAAGTYLLTRRGEDAGTGEAQPAS